MKYKYVILPTKPIQSIYNCDPKLHDAVFRFWKEFWTKEFGEEHLQIDHFLRQDKISLILDQDQIVGMNFVTFFDFRSAACMENSYFNNISEITKQRILSHDFRTCLCIEYMSVSPAYRKSVTQIPFGEVLIGLGIKLMHENQIDGMLGTTRTDVKVDKMSALFGSTCVLPELNRYNLRCNLMILPRRNAMEHPKKEIRAMINELWARRTDCSLKILRNEREMEAA